PPPAWLEAGRGQVSRQPFDAIGRDPICVMEAADAEAARAGLLHQLNALAARPKGELSPTLLPGARNVLENGRVERAGRVQIADFQHDAGDALDAERRGRVRGHPWLTGMGAYSTASSRRQQTSKKFL